MRLVVVIPALNEEATIGEVVRQVPRSIKGIDEVQILVIDDGSTDKTANEAREAGAEVVSHVSNRGVGAAFATGVRVALARGADLVVNMDGDGQFAPEDIPKLLRPILTEGVGFVTCTRFADPEVVPEMPWVKRVGNHLMSSLISRISWGNRFTDVSCGFRAYTRDTLLKLNLFGSFTYTQETFINLASHQIPMSEVPLKVRGTREYGKSRVAGSITKYIANTVPLILRTFRDLRPLLFFGTIAIAVLLIGVALGLFVFLHWVVTGQTVPYRAVLFGSTVGIILGFLLAVLALLADMLSRQRRLLEELMYWVRRSQYTQNHEDRPQSHDEGKK